MTIYNLYIFDGSGTCLFYKEWKRTRKTQMSEEEEMKLVYGMLHSLKSFVTRMSPVDAKDKFISYRTSTYKLNFYETATGLKFVLNTDLNVGDVKEILRELHSKIYVECVIRNPACEYGEPIDSELFASQLHAFLSNLKIF